MKTTVYTRFQIKFKRKNPVLEKKNFLNKFYQLECVHFKTAKIVNEVFIPVSV